ncbi:MAG TPA: response regulator, partial [Anaerolineae bacterium]|nr:response regulator [Anaerolineae bacterium]
NCEIMVTDSGEQALQLFEVRPFHLLITDYKMAGMDGLTLANRIRNLYPQTIIIIVTAYSSDDLLKSAARASINRVLDKPLEIEEIRRATLEALGGA